MLTPEQLTPAQRAVWAPHLAHPPPAWLRPLAAAAPFAIGGLWLLYLYLNERAFLRRRRPQRAPNRTTFVAETLAQVHEPTLREQRLIQLLQAREERVLPRLDVRRTIDASLRTGGKIITFEHERCARRRSIWC